MADDNGDKREPKNDVYEAFVWTGCLIDMLENEKITTIQGIVIPFEWDEGGNVLSAVIMGQDERVYLVEENEESRKLLNLLQQEVSINGVVKKAPKGQFTVAIREYYPAKPERIE